MSINKDVERFYYLIEHCLQNDWGSGKLVLRWNAPTSWDNLEHGKQLEQKAFVDYVDGLIKEKEDNEQRKRSAAP